MSSVLSPRPAPGQPSRFGRLFFAALLPLLWAAAPPAPAQERPAGLAPAAYALVGGTVRTAPDAKPFVGTVVARDGLIVAVGPTDQVAVPPDAEKIDCTGLYLYAGFLDAATDRPLDEGRIPDPAAGRDVNQTRYVLAATETDNRRGLVPAFPAQEGLSEDDKTAKSLREAGFTAVHLVPRGRIAGGKTALVTTAQAPLRETLLTEGLFAALDLSQLSGREYPNTLMGTFAHLRQAFADAERHTLHQKLWAEGAAGVPRPPADPTLEALAAVLAGDLPPLFEVSSADDARRAVNFAAEYGLAPALAAGPRLREAPSVWNPAAPGFAENAPEVIVLSLDFGSEPKREGYKKPKGDNSDEKESEDKADDDEEDDGDSNEDDDETAPADVRVPEPLRAHRARLDRWRDAVAAPAALHRAGRRFALSSRGLKSPGELLTNLRLAVKAGLPEEAALAALTRDAADLLGQGRRLGVLEAGRQAHVVALTGPFTAGEAKVRYLLIDREQYEYNDSAKPLDLAKQKRKALVAPKPVPAADAESQPTETHADRLAAQRRTGGNLIITGGTVLTGTGETIRGCTVVITDGKFALVEAGVDLKPLPDHTLLDATGKYLMPGIIDTHSHIMITEGINEATRSLTPEVRIADVIDTDDDSEYRALAGGVTTARLFHGSANVVGGQDAVVKLRYGATAEEHKLDGAKQGVKFALGENVKDSKTAFPNTRLGVEATLKRAFSEAADYARRHAAYKDAIEADPSKKDSLLPPRRDLRLEALADILGGEKFIHSHCYRADEILMLMRVAERFDVRVASLQHVLEGYKIAPEIAAHGASASTFADWWAYKVEAYDATPYNAAILHEAGVNTVIKSDDWELIRHLYLEAAKPVKYGNVSPDDVIAFVTLNPAKELGLADRIGSIEVGKDADLAVYNAHPLNSFTRVETTIVDGEIRFDRSRAVTALSAEAQERTQNPPAWSFPKPELRNLTLDLEPARGGTFALAGATIHTCDDSLGEDSVIKQGVIVVQNGVITAVGPVGQTDVPAGVPLLNVRGLTVTPGLFDAGTELGLTEIGKVSETQDYQESGDLQPDLRAGIALNRDSELIPVARAGGITHALVRPVGGLIAGQASVTQLSGWTAPEMVLELEAGLQINWPRERDYNPFDGDSTESDDRLKERIEQLTEFLEEGQRYLAAVEAAEAGGTDAFGPVPDPRFEALAPYLSGEKPVFFEANTTRQIAQSLAFAEKFGLKPIVTGAADAWKLADELAEKDVPVIVGPVMRRPTEDHDPYDAPYANPGRLYEAGVTFCLHSDEASNSRNVPFEAAQAVAYGLPEQAALRAITADAAAILGVADQAGTISPGKRASLIIADGSPLQITTSIKGVFVDGVPYAPESRQTRFYDRYLQRLRTPQASPAMR
ncbi:amidohydrolase family protein [Alienimonas californiensis]|uniref:Imidazolonepropionase n=1 Tax=Alienimonas californiensis TaxID=2527989 RepID=A0A517PF35_9PLAN|nr:amidohydrolase family protein [Alienimonas californiensis]QDT17991.1 imidazolonepropionase [Alienimonas californiensis]